MYFFSNVNDVVFFYSLIVTGGVSCASSSLLANYSCFFSPAR